jgi:hypothetical protein
MKFRAVVMVTTATKTEYIIDADSIDEAREKAGVGDTDINEPESALGEPEVINREVEEIAECKDEPDEPPGCECDNGHKQNDTVCRWCWNRGRRRWNDPEVPADAPRAQMAECQNCDWKGTEDEVVPEIKDLWQRVEAGEIMPVGECPECGALCHFAEKR